jgi:hypothetical protein
MAEAAPRTGPRRGLLLWWATNTRAAAVVAAAAVSSRIPLALVLDPAVAQPPADVLAACHVIQRPTAPLDRDELEYIVAASRKALGVDGLTLVPTSEYLLDTLYESWDGPWPAGLSVPCGSTVGYRTLSSKSWGARALAASAVLPPPARLEGLGSDMPFVAKPVVNVVDGRVLKPFLVDDAGAHRRFEAVREHHFAQEFIPGPSYYWCAHRDPDGEVTDYFQRNLLQRPGGGSIVLAAAQEPPDQERIRAELRGLLDLIGFTGPAMVELRGHRPRFIELNPRLWGPLLLDALTGGGVLDAFLHQACGIRARPFLTAAERDRAGLYVVPSALAEPLVGVAGPPATDILVPEPLRQVLVAAAGVDPTRLGGEW